ncbi:MAG: RodZ domain-containing protein [Pseudomonadota bacterium]
MNERAPELVEADAEHRPGPGGLLQAARVARGIDVAAVAAALRVTPALIDALEAERFEVFDAPVYVRGFLRTYARFVGLPMEQVLAAYDALAGEQRAPSLIPPTTAGPLPRNYSVLKLVAGLFCALLLVGASYWWWLTRAVVPVAAVPPTAMPAVQTPLASVTPDTDLEVPLQLQDSATFNGASDGDAPAVSAPVASVPATAAAAPSVTASGAATHPAVAAAKSPPHPAAPAPAPVVSPSNAKPGAPALAPPMEAAAVASPPPAAGAATVSPAVATAVTSAGPRIVLSSKADCWVEVRGSAGVRLFYGLVHAGQSHTIEGPAPWFVFFGNADAVELSVDGRAVAVPASRREGVKARFGLNADGTVR